MTANDQRERVVNILTRHFANDDLTEAELEGGSEIRALLSGEETRLVGVVPSELRVRARLGYVELDLTEARFEPVTTIDVEAFMGYVQIRLPAGIRVESTGRALIGFFAVKDRNARRSGYETDEDLVVRITGRAVLGFAEGIVVKAKR